MASNLKDRNFLSMIDLSAEEVSEVLKTAAALKTEGSQAAPASMHGKTLPMIFQKPSLRTRVSFESGMTQLGGHAVYLGPGDIILEQRETTNAGLSFDPLSSVNG